MTGKRGALVIDMAKPRRARKTPVPAAKDFQAMVSKNADAMIILDLEGCVLHANPAAESLFCLPLMELVGKFFGFPTAPYEPVELKIRRESGGMVEAETRAVEVIWAGVRYYLLSFHDTQRIHNLCPPVNSTGSHDPGSNGGGSSSRDFTGHDQAEVTQAWLASIVSSSDEAIISKTLDGVIVSWNHAAELLYGYPAEMAIGRSIELIVPDDRKGEVRDILDKIRHGERVEHYETVRTTKDGRSIDVSITISPVTDPAGQVIGASAIARDITERKRVEKALRESEERLRRMSRAGRVGLYEWNVDRDLMYFSPETYAMYAIDQGASLTFETWFSRIHPDDRERAGRSFAEAHNKARVTPGFSARFEYRVVHPDGEVYWNEVTTTYSVEGGDLISRGAALDITEQKRAEEALRESEEKFRVLAETTNAGISLYRDDVFIYVNPGLEKITGYTKAELLSMAIWDIARPDCRELVKSRAMARQRGLNAPANYEFPVLTKGGETRCDEVYAGFTRYQGEPTWIATHFDITDRKRAEEALRESERFMSTLISNLPGMVYRCANDRDWTMKFISAGCASLTGYEPADLIDSSKVAYNDLILPEDRQHVRETVRKAININQPFRIAYRITTASDEVKWVWEQGRLVGSPAGGEVWLEGFITDITERMRAENALEKAKSRAELYLDLMGHDITNMNQALMGNLELMEIMQESGNIDKTLIDDSVEIIKRSSRMISDLKKLTRLEAGSVSLKDMDLSDILAKVKSRYSLVPNRQATINYVSGENCIVRADDLLEEVFDNLVANAIRHSTGPVTVEITVDQAILDGCRYCRVSIADNGPGIPPELKRKILTTVKEIGAGEKTDRRGLGLCMVRTLVDHYRGKVWVEDRVPGDHTKGARFMVMLPAV